MQRPAADRWARPADHSWPSPSAHAYVHKGSDVRLDVEGNLLLPRRPECFTLQHQADYLPFIGSYLLMQPPPSVN